MKKKPQRNRNRPDPSKPTFPPIGNVSVDLDTGHPLLICDVPLIVNPGNIADLNVQHGSGTAAALHGVTAAANDDEFTVRLTTGSYTVVAGDILIIGSQMTGIRTSRGGNLAVGQYTFPA